MDHDFDKARSTGNAGHAGAGAVCNTGGVGRADRRIIFLVYILQALSFILGFTLIIGVIISYIKRNDTASVAARSHFRWQIRTFWYVLLWTVAGIVLMAFFIGYLILIANSIWFIYRIIKGLLRLLEDRPVAVYPA